MRAWTRVVVLVIAGSVAACRRVPLGFEVQSGDEFDQLLRRFSQIGPLAPAGGAPEMSPLVQGIREAVPEVAAEAVVACLDGLMPVVVGTAGSNDFLVVVSIRSNRLQAAALVRTADSPNWFRTGVRLLAMEGGTSRADLQSNSVACARMPEVGMWRVWRWADRGFKRGATHAYLVGLTTNMSHPNMAVWVLNRQGAKQTWICSSLDETHLFSRLERVMCGSARGPLEEE